MRAIRGRLVHIVLLAAVLAAAGCSRTPAQISGTAAFDASAPPPPDAVLEVTLQEAPRTGGAASTIGVSRVGGLKATPVAFTVPYDATVIANDREYVVQARIVSGDVVLAASGLQPVLTGGHGTTVALTLRQAEDRLAEAPLVKGMFLVDGNAPRFTPCGEQAAVAVDAGGDFAALEGAYRRARQSDSEPLLARVEGSVGGDPRKLTVTRFVSIARDQDCNAP